MGLVDTGTNEKQPIKLTVKEKLLLQLGEIRIDSDPGEYPLDLTQKGLSENVGVRRSHVAVSLQGLTEDGLVEATKGRVENEKRRQNIYLPTIKGRAKAKELRERVLSVRAEFEMPEGVRSVSATEFMRSSRAPLMSVVNQLERGGIVRDEITIVTKPERKLISVFCPTCKKSMEVENIFSGEEVGFDCPGCGRPYRIAPAEKTIVRPERKSAASYAYWLIIAAVALLSGIYSLQRFSGQFWTLSWMVAITGAVLFVFSLAMFVKGFSRPRRRSTRRTVSAILAIAAVLGAGFVILWDLAIQAIDLQAGLTPLWILAVGSAAGFIGISLTAKDLKGEFLIMCGVLVLLVGVASLSLENLRGISADAAPFLGVLGVTELVLASVYATERNGQILATTVGTGAFILIYDLGELGPSSATALRAINVGALLLLGVMMMSLRLIQRKAAMPVGELFASTLPMAAGIAFVMFAVQTIRGGSELAGALVLALILPFIYLGIRKVFDDDWMYKLPLLSYVCFVEVMLFADAFMT